MPSLESKLHPGTTSVLVLAGLKDRAGVIQTDATVTIESITEKRDGAQVTGVTFPLAVPHQANGNYEVEIPPLTGLVVGCTYLVEVLAVSAGGARSTWYEFAEAEYRQA